MEDLLLYFLDLLTYSKGKYQMAEVKRLCACIPAWTDSWPTQAHLGF